jgi:ELWxxDGT repeat protein
LNTSHNCNAGNFSFTTTKTLDSSYHFTLTATDAASNESTETLFNWVRDTVPPADLTLTSPSTTPFFSGDNTLVISGLCELGGEIYLSGDSTQQQSCLFGSFSFNFGSSINLTYNFNLVQRDQAGNQSGTTNLQWVRDDSLPPTPSLTSPSPAEIHNSLNSITIAGGCNTGFTVNLNGSSTQTMICAGSQFSFSDSKTNDGNYQYSVTQTSASNIESAPFAIKWERDTQTPTAPTITSPGTSPFSSGGGSIALGGVCETGTTVNLSGDSSASFKCNNSSYQFNISKSANTTYDFSITQSDLAGNTSTASTFQWIQDTNVPAPPQITTPSISPYLSNGSSLLIKGQCVSGNTVTINDGTDHTTPCTASEFSFTVTASTDGSYPYTFKQKSNISSFESATSSLVWNRDNTPPASPTLTSVSPISPSSSLTPKVKGTSDANTTLNVYASQDCTGTVLAIGAIATYGSTGIEVPVTANTTTDFSVKAFDLAGNASTCATTYLTYQNRRAAMVANTRTLGSDSSGPSNLFVFNGYLYFRAFHPNTGYELFRTDGTPGNTKLFKGFSVQSDGIPANSMTGITSTYLSNAPIVVGSSFYFAATDDKYGTELWKSDGTTAGTTMIKDIFPDEGGSNPYGFTLVGSTVYFKADDGTNGEELWKTDGTEAGTVMVKDINPTAGSGGGITYMTALDSKLIFFANDGTNGLEPWVSDGTSAGTQMISNLNGTASSSSPNYLVTMGSNAYFTATGSIGGNELWKTDGTTAGTSMIDLRAGGSSSPIYLTVIGNTLYFRATNSTAGAELWKSDGTLAGSSMVKDIVAGTGSSSPYHFIDSGNGFIYFVAATTNEGAELWRTDGTVAGTTLIKDISVGSTSSTFSTVPTSKVIKDGKLYFNVSTPELGSEPWVSDGTEAGTFNLRNFASGSRNSAPASFALFNSKVFFVAYDLDIGTELEITDGTIAGTQNFYDLNPVSSGSPNYMTPFGDRFVLTTWSDEYGRELYLSDGTTAGTTLIKDIAPGVDSSSPVGMFVDGNKIYFYATDDTYGMEPFISDGTASGTTLLKDINPGVSSSTPALFTKLNDKVVFRATTTNEGLELWVTDGTTAGTLLLKDINPGTTSSSPSNFMVKDGFIYFSAAGDTVGSELWKTDGTTAGTTLVKDIIAGTTGSSPASMTLMPSLNKFVFKAATSSTTGSGSELWISDGTDAGTVQLKDIYTGGTSSSPSNLKLLGDKVIFTATTATEGTELWITDGTEAGTTLLKDIRTGAVSSSITQLTVIGNKAYFSAKDGTNGTEPWVSDGTPAGTIMLKNIAPAAASSGPLYFTDFGNGQVAFRAQDGVNGWELWRTDGTATNTYLVQDINPLGGSYISTMFFWNNKLYFNPNDGVNGYELWSY